LWTASEKPAFAFDDRVHLHEVIAEVLAKLEKNFADKNIQVENHVPNTLPALSVDKPKFYRLFELLLKDEIVSLPAGSKVTLSAQLAAAGFDQATEIEVEVRDNGPGLPQDALRMLFDPFASRNDSPMEYGINLMACFFIVHHHCGKIEARSESGSGTTFTLRLPTDPNQRPAIDENRDFLHKILLNERLWEKLITAD
ncbi:MAG: HAMP domain-containing sensor histidine kinase, partial [Verrucomicrobiota bacterium]